MFRASGSSSSGVHFFTVQAASGILCNLLLYSPVLLRVLFHKCHLVGNYFGTIIMMHGTMNVKKTTKRITSGKLKADSALDNILDYKNKWFITTPDD